MKHVNKYVETELSLTISAMMETTLMETDARLNVLYKMVFVVFNTLMEHPFAS
jgi:hypothetical protein